MVDTVKTTMANENDDWEVAVDTGEFDKRLEQQEKDRAATQVIFILFNCYYLIFIVYYRNLYHPLLMMMIIKILRILI
jgi:hypothetical protein